MPWRCPKSSGSHHGSPGTGYSSKTCGGNTLKRHAQDIRELIDHLDLQHVVLLGWSLAASVVVTYASQHRQRRLNGLVMMDSSCFPSPGNPGTTTVAGTITSRTGLTPTCRSTITPRNSTTNSSPVSPTAGGHERGGPPLDHRGMQKTMPWSALELHYDFSHTRQRNAPEGNHCARIHIRGPALRPTAWTWWKNSRGGQRLQRGQLLLRGGHLMFLYKQRNSTSALSGLCAGQRTDEQLNDEGGGLMLLAITGFVMIGLLMFFLLKGKAIPMTLFVVLPILGAVINGYGLTDIAGFIKDGVSTTWSMAALFVFVVTYFGIMTDVGMFDKLVQKLIRIADGHAGDFPGGGPHCHPGPWTATAPPPT